MTWLSDAELAELRAMLARFEMVDDEAAVAQGIDVRGAMLAAWAAVPRLADEVAKRRAAEGSACSQAAQPAAGPGRQGR